MKQLKSYKVQLMKAGFSEANRRPYRFFRQETKQTAFVVNLTETKGGVGVLYGFCSTAFMAGDDEFFNNYGKDESDCNLRYYVVIEDNADELHARELIEGLYILYRNVEKDELLNVVKERRKQFLQKFNIAIKPLGFKKKGNKWTKLLASGYSLTFEAQKSAYSDQYYFNISIDSTKANSTFGCYYSRVVTDTKDIYNWQLMSDLEIEELLKKTDNILNAISNTELSVLGKYEWIWKNCACNRKRCDFCWVEKNLWEAKESEN